MEWEIRPATPGDARALRNIVRGAFAEYDGVLEVRPRALADTLEDAEQAIREGGVLLAWDGDEAMGTVRYEVRSECLYVGRLAVLPSHRRLGVGAALMRYMERVAAGAERNKIELCTRQSMPGNLAFYSRLGYHISRTEPNPRGRDTNVWFAKEVSHPTPYPDVNAILLDLLPSVQVILGDRFVGMYLYGSLALGDFTYQKSDIDFLVVTDGELPDDVVSTLQTMHERIAAIDSPWAMELEGSYIPLSALPRYDPAHALHLKIDRGENTLSEKFHAADWVIQRHVLREHGVVLAGPPPGTLIDPVQPNDLRYAVIELVRDWYARMLDDPDHILRLRFSGYQAYTVLTMCRILYTLELGAVATKPVAARWALTGQGKPWASLIQQAIDWRNGAPFDNLDETQDLIRHVVERCKRFEMPQS